MSLSARIEDIGPFLDGPGPPVDVAATVDEAKAAVERRK